MMDRCEICGCYAYCDTHHMLNGSGNRAKADKYGLTMRVCRTCHENIHRKPAKYRWIKQKAQEKAMAENGWTVEDFIREFGKSYL